MPATSAPTRILHVDGDSFFASCEIALHPEWRGKPLWVGGGRHGNGIVIAANRAAKKFGVQTGMAGFEAEALPARRRRAAQLHGIPPAVPGNVPYPRGIFPHPRPHFH